MKTNHSIHINGNGFPWMPLPVLLLLLALLAVSMTGIAQSNSNHVLLSASALYERGFDATLSYEHSTRYHNAWEFFATAYLKYEDDASAGHITKQSFWHSYNTWHIGIAYKPCVNRGRNYHGNVRIGVSGGSDLDKFLGAAHLGYEYTYALPHGWEIFFLLKEDFVLRGKDNFRSGAALGVKIPINNK